MVDCLAECLMFTLALPGRFRSCTTGRMVKTAPTLGCNLPMEHACSVSSPTLKEILSAGPSNKGIIAPLKLYTGMLIVCSGVRAGLQEVLEGYAEAMKAEKPGPANEIIVAEGTACFPLTTDRAGKQYCFDRNGAIYHVNGTLFIYISFTNVMFWFLPLEDARFMEPDGHL